MHLSTISRRLAAVLTTIEPKTGGFVELLSTWTVVDLGALAVKFRGASLLLLPFLGADMLHSNSLGFSLPPPALFCTLALRLALP